ncbi:PDZ domain-containing protein, partial [bacterium]|nr:PDZ domain-containing protein [bacterium]
MGQFQSSSLIPVKKKPWWLKIAKVYALIFLFIVIFILGVVLGASQNEPQTSEEVIAGTKDELFDIFSKDDRIDVELFTEVWDVIHNDYLDKSKIDDQKLFFGAVAGMVDALGDPHSNFLNPEVTEEFNDELSGSFSGIGAEIGRKKGYLVIIAPLPDTPADRAGLKPGDKILYIDDIEASNISTDQAIVLIRGERGTEVVLTIYSEGDNSAQEVKIIRDKIDVPSVVYNLEDDIAIVRLTSFNDDTDSRFAKT